MKTYGPHGADLQRILKMAGCSVIAQDKLHDGTTAYRLDCHTQANKVKLLRLLAEYDAHTPDVRRVAERIAQGTHGDRLQTIAALHAFVRDSVKHTPELVETFSPTMRTLELGIGDCDDSARALCALLRTLGYRADLGTLGDPPTHVACKVRAKGEWHWLETTLDALPGEHPIAARDRLRPDDRSDIA